MYTAFSKSIFTTIFLFARGCELQQLQDQVFKSFSTRFITLVVNFTIGLMRAALVGLSPAEAIELVIELFGSGKYGFINLFSELGHGSSYTLSVAGDYTLYDFDFKYGEDYSNHFFLYRQVLSLTG